MKVLIPVAIIGLGLMIYSLIEAAQTPRRMVRVMPKAAWFVVILLVPIVGAGLWLAFGRARTGGPRRPSQAPKAPDDDPEFLRQVEIRRRQQQRREEEVRRRAEQERQARGADKTQPGDSTPGDTTSGDGSPEGEAEQPGDGAERPGDDVDGPKA